MSEYGEIIGPGTLRIERLLPGPIERAWAFLTESEKRGKWLASGPMELRVGGSVELNFLHSSLTPVVEPTPERFKEIEEGCGFTGEILQVEPPRLLAFTWGGGSEVTFELAPRDEKVLLTITHRKLDDPEERVDVAAGWHTHLGILEDHVAGQSPRAFWSNWERLEAEYQERLAP